ELAKPRQGRRDWRCVLRPWLEDSTSPLSGLTIFNAIEDRGLTPTAVRRRRCAAVKSDRELAPTATCRSHAMQRSLRGTRRSAFSPGFGKFLGRLHRAEIPQLLHGEHQSFGKRARRRGAAAVLQDD